MAKSQNLLQNRIFFFKNRKNLRKIGIQNWRGDPIDESAEKEATEDMVWAMRG